MRKILLAAILSVCFACGEGPPETNRVLVVYHNDKTEEVHVEYVFTDESVWGYDKSGRYIRIPSTSIKKIVYLK